MDYCIGLSIGQLSDRSAASVVRVTDDEIMECVHLQTWQPGTPHSQVLSDLEVVAQRIATKHTWRNARQDTVYFALDVTVAGAATGSMFERSLGEHGAWVAPFVITAGTQASRGRVPKRDLVSIMRVLLDKRQLRYATALEHTATLQAELQNFRVENLSGRDDETDWRTRPHDDLVIATALACWYMQNYMGRTFVIPGIWG